MSCPLGQCWRANVRLAFAFPLACMRAGTPRGQLVSWACYRGKRGSWSLPGLRSFRGGPSRTAPPHIRAGPGGIMRRDLPGLPADPVKRAVDNAVAEVPFIDQQHDQAIAEEHVFPCCLGRGAFAVAGLDFQEHGPVTACYHQVRESGMPRAPPGIPAVMGEQPALTRAPLDLRDDLVMGHHPFPLSLSICACGRRERATGSSRMSPIWRGTAASATARP